jgi:hypothetical protein
MTMRNPSVEINQINKFITAKLDKAPKDADIQIHTCMQYKIFVSSVMAVYTTDCMDPLVKKEDNQD